MARIEEPRTSAAATRADQSQGNRHIPILDPLRGLAALAVCLFHFTSGSTDLPNQLAASDPLRWLGSFGKYGVEAFFVISGFIIPYSLYLRSYRLQDSGQFLLRRFKRIEPPYFAAILLVLGMHWLATRSGGYRGEPFQPQWAQWSAHVAYLNAFLGYEWLNPVFWTLALEFQFYLLIAVAFPLLNHRHPMVRIATLLGTIPLAVLGQHQMGLLFRWLPLFAMGTAAFQGRVGTLTRSQVGLVYACTGAVSWWLLGGVSTTTALLTGFIIQACAQRPLPSLLKPFAWVGAISYSLYLVHVPIGLRVLNLCTRLQDSDVIRYGSVVAALLLSLAFAWGFWWSIERPSQAWSQGSRRKSNSRRVRPIDIAREADRESTLA
jgi:peptidoglycan/LPS O-acetylase OafA/YrhL